jgi:AsmA protein
MRVLLRFLVWTIGLLLLLVVLAAVVLPLYVDPNDFRPQISRAVERQVGRPVEIQGAVALSVFPWLGFEVGRATLGNPPGFADPQFAAVERLDIRAKLAPLLRGELDMDTVTVHGLDLRLVRDRAGRSNWEDLTHRGTGARSLVSAVAVGGIDLRDARIAWTDEVAGQRLEVDHLALRTGTIAPARPIAIDTSARVRTGRPEVTTEVTLRGQLDADTRRQTYRLRDLTLETRSRGKGLPSEALDLTLSGQLAVDLKEETLRGSPVILKALGVQADLALSVEQLAGEPRYSVAVDMKETDLRGLLERLSGATPVTADPAALARASLSSRAAGTREAFTLDPLLVRLDESTLEGRLEVASVEGLRLRFDLSVDRLDLDRYLPPPLAGKPGPASPATAAAAATGALPVDALRRLDASGEVRVGQLKVHGLRASDVSLTVKSREGVLRVDPADAELYGGSYSGRSVLDVRGAQPRLSLKERLGGVQVESLLNDLSGRSRLRGRADASFDLTLIPTDRDTALRTLTGDGRFNVRDGAFRGVDLDRLVRGERAALDGTTPSGAGSGHDGETVFSELRGGLQVADGVARSDDLYARSAHLRAEGHGSTDLLRREVDYLLSVVLVRTGGERGDGDLEGVPIPVHVSGPLEHPRYRVRLEDALKAGAAEETLQRIEETIDRKLGGEAGEAAKELLRGLLR